MNAVVRSRGPLFLAVVVMSSLFGLSGLEHGFFEALQGNKQTEGLLIAAIGSAQRFWMHGSEPAFTLIPDYLITGIVAMFCSAAVISWSIFFMHKKHAWLVLLFLSGAQFLTGGGFVQIFLALILSLVSGRLFKPLAWWRKHVPEGLRKVCAAPRLWLFIVFIISYLFALELAVFGIPFGVTDPAAAYQLMMILAVVIVTTFVLTVVSSLARESLKSPA